MKISLDWLNDYINTNGISPEELITEFTMRSAEVESFCCVNKHFSMITTSKIININPHPNADKLNLVDVDDGNNIHTVVCGAPNIKIGQIVPLAPVGTVLPGDFEIKPVKIRGIESSGMLCSQKELGIGEDHKGIFILEEKTPPGKSFSELYGPSDFIFEIENKSITHRPDMWGHYGVAREIRAIYALEWKKKLKFEKITPEKKEEDFSIELKSPSALGYYGVKMSGLKIGPSPSWLSRRLENIGIRPINNIVDISNYVMLETGHPTHAFDRRTIDGGKISVRQAESNISFKTLDDCDRKLSSEDLVISDEKNILAIAGIMGGENSEVSSDTTEIFIESAVFDAASIRKTSGRLDLRTESSNRFEKSLPAENARLALCRFVSLVKEIVPSSFVSSDMASAENFQESFSERHIKISPDFIRSVLGVNDKTLSNEKMSQILKILEFSVKNEKNPWEVQIPAHRTSKDISIKEDIVEEVGRIHGYTAIFPEQPETPMKPVVKNINTTREDETREILWRTFGAYEILSYVFLNKKDLSILGLKEKELARTVEKREAPYLRNSMATGMIRAVENNLKNTGKFRLFEIGHVFGSRSESSRLSFAITGEDNLFLFLKKVVNTIIEAFEIPVHWFLRPNSENKFMSSDKLLHPGRSAILKAVNKNIGILGELHPRIAEYFNLSQRTGYFEIDLNKLFSLPSRKLEYSSLSVCPSTFFEFTVVTEKKTEIASIVKIIQKSVPSSLLYAWELIDSYEGEAVPEGYISLSFKVVLNAGNRTLEPGEIKEIQDRLISDIRKKDFKLKGD